MKKIGKYIKDSIKWLWQFPQNLCGIVWRRINKDNIITEVYTHYSTPLGANIYLMRNSKGGVTLGKYIFISQDYTDKDKVIKHECGHVKQSIILGPLYLLVIGIPSMLHAALNDVLGCCKYEEDGYYHFYTEKWVNKLVKKLWK